MRGPNRECAMTMREVGLRFGLSKERVHQIEKAAFRKIRNALLADPEVREVLLEHGFALAASAEGD